LLFFRTGITMLKKIAVILLVIGLAACTGLVSFEAYASFQDSHKKQQAIQKKKAAWRQLKKYLSRETNKFKGRSGIVIKDLDTGWEFVHNGDRLFPSASLVKIPIMAGVFQAVKDGRVSLDQKVRVKAGDLVSGSGVIKSMPAGSTFTVEDLTRLMVTRSDNTAANILINMLGREYLNAYFKRLGLKKTNLSRKMMDFRYRRKGIENYTTPQDVSKLLERMYNGRFISPQVSDKCLSLLKMQKVKDRIPKKLPENVVVAHKTGLERSVCHDAGIVYTANGDFLICVLTKSRSSFKNSKDFIARIASYTYHNYKMRGL
ncbi:MAG: class A beta-lactamase-related serine hydrolase, partial [Candidatus Omnitrophica bacterium]|nr:class A beta-lactamase-related serine hydrolase [Candidatus Omnitrophota bacterium]